MRKCRYKQQVGSIDSDQPVILKWNLCVVELTVSWLVSESVAASGREGAGPASQCVWLMRRRTGSRYGRPQNRSSSHSALPISKALRIDGTKQNKAKEKSVGNLCDKNHYYIPVTNMQRAREFCSYSPGVSV